MGLSTRRVLCLLWHQAGAQYLAAEWIKARIALHNDLASEPHLKPASHLKSAAPAFYSVIADVDDM